MLQTLQQLWCSRFEKLISYITRSSFFCHFISILLPFSFLQQLTINGFQVTPILVALFLSTVSCHKLLKMIFSFTFFPSCPISPVLYTLNEANKQALMVVLENMSYRINKPLESLWACCANPLKPWRISLLCFTRSGHVL